MTAPAAADGYAGASNLEAMTAARRYNAFLEQMVIDSAGGARSALDFGAGGGEFARRVAARGLEVACVEPDAALRRGLEADGLAAHADLSAVAPGSQPFIYTLNVLEHIEDDAEAMRALYDRLAPGGTLFVYVPAFQVLYGPMDRLVGHCRRYTRGALTRRAAEAGFAVEASGYADPLGWFAALAHRLVGSESGRISDRSVALYDGLVFPASRALHPATRGWIGKNVWLRARRAA